MEFLHLKYFQTVARTEHMTNSAKQLNIVQPALSRSIQALEKELGVTLFDRNGKGIKLNDNGKLFLKFTDGVLHNLENTKKQLMEMNNKANMEIKVLVLAASTIVPDLIMQFRNKYKDIKFTLLQSVPENTNSNYFDFCISTTHNATNSENSIVIFEEELLIGVPFDHHLANKDTIELHEVASESFINFKKDKPFRQISENLCKKAGFVPHTIFESDSPEIVRRLIKAGLGVSFIPQRSWFTTESVPLSNSIKLLHVSGISCKRYLVLTWDTNTYKSLNSELFKEFVIDYFGKK